MKKILILPTYLFFITTNAQIQNSSSNLNTPENIEFDKTPFMKKDWVKMTTAPVLLFAGSAATWHERTNIRNIRNRYIPSFDIGYDDYLQYAPTATVYALKLAGVTGRNNTLRATISYASSLAIMGILVNTVKYTAKVERPDQSANNSFPSGHTAMAFTNASFLHKEYGMVSPGYSIGGYSVATFTGIGRYLNNRHWVSDILAGAGIGILSSELGYFFVNKFYKNKGDNMGLLSKIEGNDNPSFLALKAGPTIATTNFLKESELDDRKETGFEMGFEGAYFFNKHWGVGADITFSSFPVTPKLFKLDDKAAESYEVYTQSLGFLNFGIGPYYTYHFDDKFQLMLKSTIGYNTKSSGKILLKDEHSKNTNYELEIAEYKPSNSIRLTNGAALTYKLNPELGISAYADFNHTTSKIDYEFSQILEDDEIDDRLNHQTKDKINYISLGLKLTAYF